MRSGPSRAVWPVAGSRPVELIACDMTRRRIVSIGRVACRMARRRIACGITRRSFTSRPIPAPLGDRMSLRCSRSGAPKVRRQPCPGPTAPVADAATGGFETFFLLHGRGALSWPVRRRGSGGALGRSHVMSHAEQASPSHLCDTRCRTIRT